MSQKVEGLRLLSRNHYPVPQFVSYGPGPQKVGFSEHAFGEVKKVMIRPCPSTPMHGWYESFPVPVEYADQVATAVSHRITKSDPNAYVVVQDYIPAVFNLVVTHDMITVGPGHDGATAGKLSISYRTSVDVAPGYAAELVVSSFHGVYYVQYRELSGLPGETPVSNSGYISSRPFRVRWIIDANEVSDFSFPTCLAKVKDKGTVVYHPGGSPISHKGVWARIYNIPYFYGERPVLFEEYKASTYEVNLTHDSNRLWYAGFIIGWAADGISLMKAFDAVCEMHGFKEKIDRAHCLARFALASACVAHMGIDGYVADPFGSGLGAGMLHRLVYIACQGEMRYFKFGRFCRGAGARFDAWLKHLNPTRTRLGCAKKFLHPSWANAYGGKKWYNIARMLEENVSYVFRRSPRQMLSMTNALMDMFHNCQRVINKFEVDGINFDAMSKGDVIQWARGIVTLVLLRKAATHMVRLDRESLLALS